MRKIIFLQFVIPLIIPFVLTSAQEHHNSCSMPIYSEGFSKLKSFIAENNNYKSGVDKANSGIVTVGYIINKEGKLENIKIIRGINEKYDSEAIRITKLINGWRPAVQMGKAINHKVVMPIEFCLDKEIKKEGQITISGSVTDESTGKPIEGLFVILKGTNFGTITSSDGLFSLDVSSEEAELEFNSVGYKSVVEKIGKNRILNIELISDVMIIDLK